MSGRDPRVRFSGTPPLKSAMKQSTREHHRDSGVGSSSSDHTTSSSGNLDERFADYATSSSDPAVLRDALNNSIEKVEQWKSKFYTRDAECNRALAEKRSAERLYQKEVDMSTALRQTTRELEQQIEDLKLERNDWSTRYYDLYDSMHQTDSPAGISTDSAGSSRHHSKKDSKEMTDRLKERINKNQPVAAESSRARAPERERHSDRRRPSRTRRHSVSINADNAPRRTAPDVELLSPRTTRAMQPTTHTAAPGHESGDYVPYPIAHR
ncbi:hypothetical protein F5Y16DRAFT_404813 [Xylariaceae sp. FL0255]|nr:hypothetical protein F5Y16DRAFT_404813 [Xylariaceae sp. FL0255]